MHLLPLFSGRHRVETSIFTRHLGNGLKYGTGNVTARVLRRRRPKTTTPKNGPESPDLVRDSTPGACVICLAHARMRELPDACSHVTDANAGE
jgi:hypothetical protein